MSDGTVLTASHTPSQERQEWLQRRMNGVGSSDTPVILGLSKWKIPLTLYLEKVGEIEPAPQTEAQRSGLLQEAVIAARYEEETGNKVSFPSSRLTMHPTIPWMFASIDRMAQVFTSQRILELKNYRYDDGWGAEHTQDIPPDIYAQVQHQMECAQIPWADVAVLLGGQELRVYHIPYDYAYCQELVKQVEVFWRMVVERTPPPYDWSHPDTARVIRQKQKLTPDKEIILDDRDTAVLLLQFSSMKKQLKELQQAKDTCQARLIERMGDAQVALTPAGYRMTRRPIHKEGYWVEPSDSYRFDLREPK